MPFPRKLTGAALAAALLGLAASAEAGVCPIGSAFEYLGKSVLQSEAGQPWLFVTAEKLVDADGAPNAYSPKDLAMGCPHAGVGLDCLDSAGYPGSDWWSNVLVRDPDDPDKPYVQEDGPFRGYFVSMTSLRNPDYAGRLSPASYVDASQIPYLVLPAPLHASEGMGRTGDIGYALDLASGRSTPFVIADEGPVEPLGEASVAFWRALSAVAPNARDGSGLTPDPVAIMVFPGSGATAALDWPIDPAALRTKAGERLASFGGLGALQTCAELAQQIPAPTAETQTDD